MARHGLLRRSRAVSYRTSVEQGTAYGTAEDTHIRRFRSHVRPDPDFPALHTPRTGVTGATLVQTWSLPMPASSDCQVWASILPVFPGVGAPTKGFARPLAAGPYVPGAIAGAGGHRRTRSGTTPDLSAKVAAVGTRSWDPCQESLQGWEVRVPTPRVFAGAHFALLSKHQVNGVAYYSGDPTWS